MTQRLPDYISALGEVYRVEYIPNLCAPDGDPVHGYTDSTHRIIRINSDLDRRRQLSTMVHEYVHAILHVSGVGNVLTDELEEVIAQSIEHGIMQLLGQLGPELVKAAKEGKK